MITEIGRPANIGELSRGSYHLLFPVLPPTPTLSLIPPLPLALPLSHPFSFLCSPCPIPLQIQLRGKLSHRVRTEAGRQTHFSGTDAKTGHMALG